MNRSRRGFLQGFAQAHLLALGGCTTRTTADTRGSLEQFWTKRFADLEQHTIDSAGRHSVPGVSLAAIKDARLVWSRGLGIRDQTSHSLLTEDSVFEAASMSKPVFAYAVMKLHERGVLDLDRPLTTYTAERFLNGDPRLELITARHVLSHTSGFPDIRSRENPLKIHFKPGEKWQYSGEGYAYLQSVTTKLTGHVLSSPCGIYEADLKVCGTDSDSYMQTNVLRPLGMRSSGYLWHDGLDKYLARPHDAEGRLLGARKYTSADAARYGSMGGLLTTATDYANFLIAIMEPKPADVFRLRKVSIDEMLTPQVKVEDGPGPFHLVGARLEDCENARVWRARQPWRRSIGFSLTGGDVAEPEIWLCNPDQW